MAAHSLIGAFIALFLVLSVVGDKISTLSDTEIETRETAVEEESNKEEEEEEEIDLDTNIIDLLSVERNPIPQGSRYTVRFKKNIAELSYKYHDQYGPGKTPESEVNEGDGVWSVSFNTTSGTPATQQSAWILIGDRAFTDDREGLQWSRMIGLQLDNSNSSHKVQEIPSLPVLHSKPSKDAVYEPGQDINITSFVWLDNSTGALQPDGIYTSFTGVNLTTGKFHIYFDRDLLFKIYEEEHTEEKLERTITMLTSTKHVSGFFHAEVMIEGEEGVDLIMRMQISKYVRVRPSNQAMSLPPNYLAFMEIPSEKSENGNELVRCRVGSECPVRCYAIGHGIGDVRVTRLLSNGTAASVPSMKASHQEGESYGAVHWTFEAKENSGDSNGITTFRCRAISRTSHVMVTKLIDVQAAIPGSIDGVRSNMTVEHDPMNPTSKIVTLRCAIRGRPLPSVSFSGGSSGDYNLGDHNPDQVIETGRNEAVAIKVVRVDYYHLQSHKMEVAELHGQGPSCEFWDVLGGGSHTHVFEIPDFDPYS